MQGWWFQHVTNTNSNCVHCVCNASPVLYFLVNHHMLFESEFFFASAALLRE
jgi:hypothetical protein